MREISHNENAVAVLGIMDVNDVLTRMGAGIGQGMAASASLLGAITVFGIPVSYVANRYIYHRKGMRALLTIVAAILSIPILLCMLIYQGITWGNGLSKVHYFGFMPFITRGMERPTESMEDEMGWFMPLLTPIWNFVRDTLFAGFIEHRDTSEDESAYNNSMNSILLPLERKNDPRLAVSEGAVLKALEAAHQMTKEGALALEEDQMEMQQQATPQ